MSDFCECGVCDDLDENGLCSTCSAAPHGRDCYCGECEDYWARVACDSEVAAERFRKRLICTCGWMGMYAEHHTDRRDDCEITLRETEAERVP